MDFNLTSEQKLIKNTMREFALKYVEPVAAELDETARFPQDIFEKLAAGGWMGMPFPVEYGGQGTDYLTCMLAIEELARSCAATAFTMSVHTGVSSMAIFLYGTEEQKKVYLTPMAQGKHLGALAFTEPGAGTDVSAATSTAVLDDDEYVINGTKTFCSNGPVADTYIVAAWTDKSAGSKGMSAFIVPKGTPGLIIGSHFMKMGIRSSQTSEVIFKDCRIPKSNLLGSEGDGLKIAMSCFENGRIGIASQCNGIIQAALDESISYSKQRIQFGKPISKNQAVQWWMVDMATDLNAGRFLTYHAAFLKDSGKPFSKEASMAKLFCSEAAMKHTIKAVQIYGGYGYVKGVKVERLMRDAKVTEIYEGTSEAQRMVIGGSILR